MKISTFTLGLLAASAPLAAAWSKEDREIFRIRDEIAAHEPASTTFYDVLGTSASASQDVINKAFRKKTLALHPDKVKQQLEVARKKAEKLAAKAGKDDKAAAAVKPLSPAEVNVAIKEASERQARLSLIAGILRGPGRERYDHFLKNGFPVWKGTEYYYDRYRPGLATVLLGLFFFGGGGVHYLILWMNWRRQREFIERYIKFARETAWGSSLGIPGVDPTGAAAAAASAGPAGGAEGDEEGAPQAVNRRQRRMQERDARRESVKETTGSRKTRKTTAGASSRDAPQPQPQPQSQQVPAGRGPTGPKKRVVAENGKVLVVDSLRDVYLEQEDEGGHVTEYLLDPREIHRPTVRDTLLVRLPVWSYRSTVGRLVSTRAGTRAGASGANSAATTESELDGEKFKIIDAHAGEDDDSDAAQHTPAGSDSADEFELVDKSVDSIGKARSSGSQAQAGGNGGSSRGAGKRKSRKK